MSAPMLPNSKNFWDRPEGKTGKIFFILLLLGLGYGLFTFLPFIIALMQNTLYAMVLAAAIGGVTIIGLDKKFQTLVSYAYRSIMRGITKAFIELDPVAIIDNYVDDLVKNLNSMEGHVTNLRAQMGKLRKVIEDNERQLTDNMKLAEKAREMGKQEMLLLKSRKAGRLQNSNMTLQTLYQKMEMLHRVLSKYKENAGLYIEDLKDEVDVKKREREAIRAGHSAFKSALKILNGDQDKVSMFEIAMQSMADDVGSRVGEMEEFMSMSKGFIDSIDLQNGVFEEDGLKALEEWEKKGTSLFFKEEEKQMLLSANHSQPLASSIINQRNNSEYSYLLKR